MSFFNNFKSIKDMLFPKGMKFFRRAAIFGVCAAIGSLIALKSFKSIPAGHVGYSNLFGNVQDEEYVSGFTFINPLATMVKVNLRKNLFSNSSSVASKEGLEIAVNIDVVYRLDKRAARDTYINVGPKYEDVLLIPQINSCVRDAIAGYEAKDLYNDKIRVEIKEKILNDLSRMVVDGIIIEDILINKIVLPAGLRNSIENKLQAEQAMQKMDFTLAQERKESERKQIEAHGIKAFQDTVALGISKELLEWKGITATEELAKSPNTKIVIIGNTKNGLPLIFSDNRS